MKVNCNKFLKISINFARRASKFLLIFFIVISWVFSGFPRIWQNPRIPPEIQEAQAAISLVQQATAGHTYSSPSTSLTVTLTSGATAGNLLVAAIATDKNAGTYTVPTGFTRIGTAYTGASVSGDFAYKIATGGETIITWSYTNSEESSMWVAEYSGTATSGVLDVNAAANSGETTVSSQTTGTTAATSQADEIAIAIFGIDSSLGAATSRSWTNSFTEQTYVNPPGSYTAGLGVAQKTLSSTGTQQTTVSWSPTADQAHAKIATFKAMVATTATISSAADQTFTVGDAATAISTITITDYTTPTITAANDIRIKIPSTFNMTWDETDTTATIGGGAAAKVSTTVSYEDLNRTLVVNVITNFAASDQITVSGLSFKNFTAASAADNLELEVYNDNTTQDYDDKTITINYASKSFQDGVYPTAAYAGTRDTVIKQQAATTNYGTQASLDIDGDDPPSGGQDNWGIIKWDVSDIPSGSTVQSATITIYIFNEGSAYPIYEMKKNWTETGATWNTYDGTNNWETAGAQGTTDRGTTSFGTNPSAVTGSQTITLNASGITEVQDWINNPSTNYGIIWGDSALTNGLDFDSREGATVSQRPRLTIEYTTASLTFVVNTDVFPSLTPGAPVFATSTLSVDTNNSTGWNVTLLRDDAETTMDLDTDATVNITDQTAWSPGAATTTAGNAVRISSLDSSGDVLAMRVMTASGTALFISTVWWGTTDSYIDSATTLWAGFNSAAQKIGDSSVSSGGSAKLNTVLYYLDVPSTKQTGAYSGGITYTATMNP